MSKKDLPIFPRSSMKHRVGALEMLQREFCTEGPDETGVPEMGPSRCCRRVVVKEVLAGSCWHGVFAKLISSDSS